MPYDPAIAYAHLSAIIEQCPEFAYSENSIQDEHLSWLGRAEALLEKYSPLQHLTSFRVATRLLYTMSHSWSALLLPLHAALAKVELDLPEAAQGAYIPAGDKFNGYASLVKLLSKREGGVLVVDPYLDGTFFVDFVPLATRLAKLRCLTSDRYISSLKAAAERWTTDRQPQVAIEVRVTSRKALHDRLILFENGEVSLVSQSLKDIGAKSPASVQRASDEIAAHKIEFYEEEWAKADEVLSYSV